MAKGGHSKLPTFSTGPLADPYSFNFALALLIRAPFEKALCKTLRGAAVFRLG